MAGWWWFLATSGIVYGSFTAVGCIVLIVYNVRTEHLRRQRLKEEVDHYAEFVGEYHNAVSEDVEPKPPSLEVYSKTIWSPMSVTNCRDYRRNCSETLSARLYGDDQSRPAESPLATGLPLASGSITSWSIYDEDRQQFTSINSTPFYEPEEGEASSSRLSTLSSPSTSPRTPPAENMHHALERPKLTVSTIWEGRSLNNNNDTPTTATVSPNSQDEGLTPYTATEYSPATSIASSYASFARRDLDCEDDDDDDQTGRASFETVGLDVDALYRAEFDVDMEACRSSSRSQSDFYYFGKDAKEAEKQWHESVSRMTKKMSSTIQSLFVKGKVGGETQQQQQQQQQEQDNVPVRQFLEV